MQMQFENNFIKEKEKSESEILTLYNNEVYIPTYDNENSIFYFVREPGISNFKDWKNEDEYLEYLKFMEGSANSLKIRNYCYEGVLILDGTFTIPLNYDDLIKVRIGDYKIKTLL
jgi:hypothetical protein